MTVKPAKWTSHRLLDPDDYHRDRLKGATWQELHAVQKDLDRQALLAAYFALLFFLPLLIGSFWALANL